MMMLHRELIIGMTLALACGSAEGSNLLRFKDGSIRVLGTFEAWGYQIPSWPEVPGDELAFDDLLRPKVVQGINSVGFNLHDPARGATFFRPDGEPADNAIEGKFARMAGSMRYHIIAMFVNPFSSDPEAWLASPAAYRTAVKVAAKAVPEWHSAILVIGDPFSDKPWPAEAPLALNDPAVIIELAGLIKESHSDILLAVPAASFPAADKNHWLYVTSSVDALTKQVHSLSQPQPSKVVVQDVLAIPKERFFVPVLVNTAAPTAMDVFLKRVEETRLAVRLSESTSTPAREPVRLSPEEEKEGWQLLFDGRTLNGWTTLLPDAGGWVVQDGLLHCTGQSGPWLRTRQAFDDFILRFEFKIEPNGNSGVFLRAPLDGRASRFSMEMQIFGKQPAAPDKRDSTGAIYSVLAPLENTANPPGQWNDAEIVCRGSGVTIRVNGRLAQDFDMNDVPELKNRLRRGRIGLQDHGNKAWFRDIRIKTLSHTPASPNNGE